jgi:hypothetical protein
MTISPCSVNGSPFQAISNYSSNVISRWIGPGNLPIASVGAASSYVQINYPGTYTVEFKDNSSNCISTKTILVTYLNPPLPGAPVFSVTASSFTSCSGSVINIINPQTNPPGGNVSGTVIVVTPTTPLTFTSSLQNLALYTNSFSVNQCGNYAVYVMDAVSQCISSYTLNIGPSGWIPTNIREANLLAKSLSMYPNPASDYLTIQNTLGSPLSYTLVDVLGREVLDGNFAGFKTLDISALSQGAYFIKFECDGISTYKKLVVEKR